MNTKIYLTESDFTALVKGQEITIKGIKILLADIGTHRLIDILFNQLKDQ